MSLNLGPEAYEAVTRLKNNSDWRAFVAALHEQLNAFVHRALEVPPESRVDATGYARSLADLLTLIDQIEHAKQGYRGTKPTVRVKEPLSV